MINVFKYPDGEVNVWIDAEESPRQGVCIGIGRTEAQALRQAASTLTKELDYIHKHLEKIASVPKSGAEG